MELTDIWRKPRTERVSKIFFEFPFLSFPFSVVSSCLLLSLGRREGVMGWGVERERFCPPTPVAVLKYFKYQAPEVLASNWD